MRVRLHNPKTVIIGEREDSQLVIRSNLTGDELENRPLCRVRTNDAARHRGEKIDHLGTVKRMTPPVFEKSLVMRTLFAVSSFALFSFVLARRKHKSLNPRERLRI